MKLSLILKPIFILSIILAVAIKSYAAEDIINSPLTLKDCYLLSLKQSEDIAIDSKLIRETEARFNQAFGMLLPHVYFKYNNYTNDDADALVSGNGAESMFNIKQTLFSGFKEFISMKASSIERSQRINEKIRAEQLLLVDVANAFYLFAEQKKDMESLQAIRASLANRVKELREREKLGRSRRSEVVNTETQLYNLGADVELVRNRLILSRQLLEFLTGVKIVDIVDSEEELPVLGLEEDYTTKWPSRPDVLASGQAWEVSKQKANITKSGLLPSVTAEGNYYLERSGSVDSLNKWDAVFKVSVPIFEGTEVYGAIQEANLKSSEAELRFKQTKRKAFADIRDAYARIATAIPRCVALRKALKAAEMNYSLQKEDYRLSLVNNLEVLASIQTLENTRRNFIQALYETKRLYWQLRTAVGQVELGEIK